MTRDGTILARGAGDPLDREWDGIQLRCGGREPPAHATRHPLILGSLHDPALPDGPPTSLAGTIGSCHPGT